METSVRRLPKSQVEVTLTLSADEVNRVFDKVYQDLAQGPIPGFRPGKAPRIIIRRRFGEERIRSTVLGEILQEHLEAAVKRVEEENLQPLGEPVLPNMEEIQPTEGEPLSIPVIVAVYPEPQFDDLSGMKILRPVAEVTDEDVDAFLEQLLDAHAEWVEVSRAIAPGDRVRIAVQRTVDGAVDIDVDDVTVTAAEPDNQDADIVLRKIVGHMAGQTVEFDYDVPENADDPAAGKTAHYKVTIHEVREKKLPELTDEFARQSLGAQTVDELRAKVREDLQRQREEQAFEEMRSQAVAHLLARCDIELPDVMVESALQSRLQELEQELGEIGTSLAEVLAQGDVDAQEFVEGQRERVVLLLETKVALDALAEREGLEPEEEDIEAEIQALARRTDNTVDFIRQAYEVQEEITERIDNAAKTRRVVRWLIEQAQIEDVPQEEFEEKVRELMEQLREQRQQRRKKAEEAAKAEEEAEKIAEAAPAEAEAEAEGAAGAEQQAQVAPAGSEQTSEAAADDEASHTEPQQTGSDESGGQDS